MFISKVLSAILFLTPVITATQHATAEEEKERLWFMAKMSTKQMPILDHHTLVTRIAVTPLYRYRGYRTAAVLFYPMPIEVSEAKFVFQAENIHLNIIGSCQEEEVDIYLKHGSYPAVNPDGYPFPEGFITSRDEEVYHIPITTDKTVHRFELDNPRPGHWYGIAFLKWQDPRTQAVTQQGLSARCQAVLYTDLQVVTQQTQITDCYSKISVDMTNETRIDRKCMSNGDPDELELDLEVEGADSRNVSVKIQASSLPSENNTIVHCYFSLTKQQVIKLQPHPNTWHYIQFEVLNATDIAECESYSTTYEEDIVDRTNFNLMREDKGHFFSFDYSQPSPDLQESLSVVNLTCHNVTSLKYSVNPFLDIGGTVTLSAIIMIKSTKYYYDYKRLPDVTNSTLLTFNVNEPYFKIVICRSINYVSLPLENGMCRYNDITKPALFILNNTDSHTIHDSVRIPFPEAGDWFISIRLFCDDTVCPCSTFDNGTKYYVETNKTNLNRYKYESSLNRNVYNGSTDCDATVMFAVSSMPCVDGGCSNHGNCLLASGFGHVLSTCSCISGYGGWDCSDNSRMDSFSATLLAVLLLTLSNLPFMFSTYVAIIRLYFAEAVMYAFTMLLSTFYHACDAPSSVAYCIASLRVLQFGDFYCGIMSFWVTLLAMSILPHSAVMILQLAGAIVVAILTTWNMQSLYAFMLPVCVGIVVAVASWFVNYYEKRSLFFPKSYYKRYLPAGIVLVGIGLICYAFLQTEQNYKTVHSIWHMTVALSIVFLLPDCRRGDVKNQFMPRDNNFKFWKPLRLTQ